MNTTPLSAALGLEISGFEFSSDRSESFAAEVRALLLKHRVLVFRDLGLSPSELVRFAAMFGEPVVYPYSRGLREALEVVEILRTERQIENFGGSWHSDTPYLRRPCRGAVLQAMDIPPVGGDTLFSNTVAALKALPSVMQEALSGLQCVHHSISGQEEYRGPSAEMSFDDSASQSSRHPLVRTHPETLERSLYFSLRHLKHIEGMSVADSRDLVQFLTSHISQSQFVCRVRWALGTVAVWDNRGTLHNALNDYLGYRRRMWRVILAGERPA